MQRALLWLLVHHCGATGNMQPIHKVYCIIHHKVLCTKSVKLGDIMSVVVKVIIYSFNHCQLLVLLDVLKMHYDYRLYFCQVPVD